MKAHDVRQLRICQHCGKLCDRRESLMTADGRHSHGSCYIAKYGLEKMLVAFSDEALSVLTASDIGRDLKVLRDAMDHPRGRIYAAAHLANKGTLKQRVAGHRKRLRAKYPGVKA